ncbi:alpha/beta hydrolase [Microbacter sp. GSS18]|nr:alpha/beta hydrolase [Microbacter sp. GSS18]
MMKTSQRIVQGLFGATSAVSPGLAARIALPLFMRVGRRMPVDPADAATMLRARTWEALIPGTRGRGARVGVYEWGTGADVVLLVHGWQGRASQFAPLVRELLAERFRVVAVDMPAHGDAPGRATTIVDWISAIRAVQARHGALHGIVGHSLGGLAVLVAVAEGVQVRRVVTASAPADAAAVFDVFAAGAGLDDAADVSMRALFARRYFDEDDPIGRVSAVAHPLGDAVHALIAHDRRDRVIPHAEADRLRAALPQAATLDTDGAWHARLVRSDAFLDAAVAHLTLPDHALAPAHFEARAGGQGVSL